MSKKLEHYFGNFSTFFELQNYFVVVLGTVVKTAKPTKLASIIDIHFCKYKQIWLSLFGILNVFSQNIKNFTPKESTGPVW